jgi:DNA-binding transcriptional ArsR family regulator
VTNLTTAATLTKTLGHAGRLRILAMLRTGPLSVCQMATILDTPVSTISGYLLKLRQAGLVREQRRGKWVYYRLTNVEPITSVLASVLTAIADDPEVRRDAATLQGTSLVAGCDTRDVEDAPDDTPNRSRTVRTGWTAPRKSL